MWRRSFLAPQPLPFLRVPASLHPTRLQCTESKKQHRRSRGRQCQVPPVPAVAGSAQAGRLGEPRRGGGLTPLRTLHLLPRGHPAGGARTSPQQLARTRPGLQLGHKQPSGARTKSDHRVAEWPILEGASNITSLHPSLPQAGPPTSIFIRPGCPGPHPPGLEYLQGEASTTSLGSLFPHLTTLIVQNFPLTSILNLPSLNLKPFPLVLPLSTLPKN